VSHSESTEIAFNPKMNSFVHALMLSEVFSVAKRFAAVRTLPTIQLFLAQRLGMMSEQMRLL